MIALLFLLPLQLFAGELSQVMRVQSHEDLQSFEAKSRQNLQWQTLCEWEKQQQHFPQHCFPIVEEILAHPLDRRLWESMKQTMNRLCQQAVDELSDLSQIKSYLQSPILAEPCRQALLQRQMDLIYIEESSGPKIE
ncbi:MAG: hypothetical protein KDD33_09910 [Bdellovibrionales bacterium]|nr:hypothetical protein [Bdellovibrionales bacterium]